VLLEARKCSDPSSGSISRIWRMPRKRVRSSALDGRVSWPTYTFSDWRIGHGVFNPNPDQDPPLKTDLVVSVRDHGWRKRKGTSYSHRSGVVNDSSRPTAESFVVPVVGCRVVSRALRFRGPASAVALLDEEFAKLERQSPVPKLMSRMDFKGPRRVPR